MHRLRFLKCANIFAIALAVCAPPIWAQSANSGTVAGVVVDASGAVLAHANVTLRNPATYQRTVASDAKGEFRFLNVPLDTYQLIVSAKSFAPSAQTVLVESPVPIQLRVQMNVAAANTSITVAAEGATILENAPAAHTDVSQTMLAELPDLSPGSSLQDAITLSSPSVAADSNGFFHPLGDHAQTTYVIDGQPISDQQSKLFSTSIPANALESMDLVTAAPSAEYGDKTSLVVQATTRSGLGMTQPTGSFDAYYGSFGTVGEDASVGFGGTKIGDYLTLDSVRSGRFLDSPEFDPLHDIGNNGSLFDRIDYQIDPIDVFHVDLFGARNLFQVPNTYDQEAAGQNQRQRVLSFNIAPSYQRVVSPRMLVTVDTWLRKDHVDYYPSANLFSDQPATVGQNRFLTNYGGKVDLSYDRWHNNVTAGTQVMQTRLLENFDLGLTDPLFNAICVGSNGDPVVAPGITNPNDCATAGYAPNPSLNPGLVPYDLTRGGSLFTFNGNKNIDEYAAYLEDAVTLGNLNISPGLRVDRYVGLVTYTGWEPRIGASYLLKPTGTVLRLSAAHTYDSPYNENLILSSATGAGGLATNVFGAYAGVPLQPDKRNDYDAGLQQNITKYVQIDGDYFWKYTRNAFDFDTVLNTPITFPITWNKSKIDGVGVRVSTIQMHGISVDTNMGHTRSRFFGPENGGIIFNSPLDTGAFRIDHDQAFQQTTNVRYQLRKNVWTMLTWNYESGLVAGYFSGPNGLADALALDADQQAAIGFYCGSQVATLANPITSCNLPYPQWGATRVDIPAPGTENDDTNPPRIAPRNLFDVGIGDDDVMNTEFGRMTLRFTATNLTNKDALYNFLSTFSGTHFVEPRAVVAQVGFEF